MVKYSAVVGALAALSLAAVGDAKPLASADNVAYWLRGSRELHGLYCNSIGCPGGYTPIADAMNTECDGETCEVSQCCEAFCSYHPCPDNYVPIDYASTTLCADSGCTTDLCCDLHQNENFSYALDDDLTEVLYCNSIGCPGGYTPITDAMNTPCDGDTCEVSQCCEAFCSYHPCPDNFIPIEDAATTLCEDSGCTTELCCDLGGDFSYSFDGYGGEW